MSTQPITNHRQFEIVTPAELKQLRRFQRDINPEIDDAVRYLARHPGEAVRVKVYAKRLDRLRKSALGYAARRGISVKTRHQDGWLYIIRGGQ